jgi:hypothetical protein
LTIENNKSLFTFKPANITIGCSVFFLFGELLLSLGDPKIERKKEKSVNPAKGFFLLKKKA